MKKRKKCLCCNNKKIQEIINLGEHSFADRFIPKNKIKFQDPKYPLILDLCNKCSFINLDILPNQSTDIFRRLFLYFFKFKLLKKSLDKFCKKYCKQNSN